MRAKVKAGTEEFDPIAKYCYERWNDGKGVSLQISPERFVYMVPEKLIRDGATGLVISDTDGACLVYRGGEPLNEFILVQKGFSLQMGRSIASIVNALIEHFQWGSSNPKDAAMPQLTYQEKGESNE